jgi:hypothetical protein
MLCLLNPSFEAKPTGTIPPLDVEEWSDCTSDGYLNTPDIGSAPVAPSALARPAATDGMYYLGLTEEEQVSQRMCTVLRAGESGTFEIDMMRVHEASFSVDIVRQRVFVEVWGGIATDCSQRHLLWASPPLTSSWERYCVTITAGDFTDQLTLRARSDRTSATLGYVALDNLRPVERCLTP